MLVLHEIRVMAEIVFPRAGNLIPDRATKVQRSGSLFEVEYLTVGRPNRPESEQISFQLMRSSSLNIHVEFLLVDRVNAFEQNPVISVEVLGIRDRVYLYKAESHFSSAF